MHGEIYADAQQAADAVDRDVDALSFWATDTPNGLQPLRDIELPTKVRRLKQRSEGDVSSHHFGWKANRRTGGNHLCYSPSGHCPASAISMFKLAAHACAHALI